MLTDEQVVALRADYAAGATIAELAARYGASGPTVSMAARGLSYKHVAGPVSVRSPNRGVGQFRPVLTDEQVVALRADYAAGATTVELVERYGASGATVNRAARGVSYKHVPMPPDDDEGDEGEWDAVSQARLRSWQGSRSLTDEQVAKARADYAAGVRTVDIADALGRHVSTVWDMISGKTYTHLPGAWKGPARMTGQNTPRVVTVAPAGLRICTVEGCDRSASTRGMCKTHYKRLLRRGTADPDRPIGGDDKKHNQYNAPGEIGVLILFHDTATADDAALVAKVCSHLPGVSVARALPATN